MKYLLFACLMIGVVYILIIGQSEHLDTEQSTDVRQTLCSDPDTAEFMNGTAHPCP